MAPNEIRNLIAAAPFVPFRMVISDGTTYDVDDPYMVLVGNRSVHLGIPAIPGDQVADRIIRLDLIHITQLIPLAAAPPPSGNGQSSG